MQKWEYQWLWRGRGIKGSWTGTYPDAGKWDSDIPARLAALGDEGWELVAVVPHSSWAGEGAGFTSDELWVFKRPKL